MIDLLEQLDDNAAKLRLLTQDAERIGRNPYYSLLSNGPSVRQKDLLAVKAKKAKALIRRHKLLNKYCKLAVEEMGTIVNKLEALKI